MNGSKWHLTNFAFRNWNKEKSDGLDVRRANEQRLFFQGNYKYDFRLHTDDWKHDRIRYLYPEFENPIILQNKNKS